MRTSCGTDPERIFQSLLILQENCDSTPHLVASRAELLYRFLVRIRAALPSDLASFFVGAAARIAGASRRLSGSPDEAFEWLDVAEAAFQEGICARPELARVTYQRLAVLYGLGRSGLVNDAIQTLEKGFLAFGMREDYVKCRILWASSLKISGRCEVALDVLEPLRKMRHEITPALFGRVLLELGDLHQIEGDYDRGLADLNEAATLLREGGQLTGLADAASMLGASCRARGMLNEAIRFYEKGREAYSQLGMKYLEAYMRILLAETYLAMGKLVETERQVLAALPTLQEQHMVVEVTAGLGILQEAARRRSLDPVALREFVQGRGHKRT
ncbi:MAG TPA: tetratricopeptide repeat protein [Thermoanaerobaculia bacterium]|nr:tetratricopeptide repeat protein [Thermoanaerobaculia bacterium]